MSKERVGVPSRTTSSTPLDMTSHTLTLWESGQLSGSMSMHPLLTTDSATAQIESESSILVLTESTLMELKSVTSCPSILMLVLEGRAMSQNRFRG